MVRKQVFSIEDVVRAGFSVVDAEGWDQLSARKVADVLGSSTAPVYSNFENMGQLAEAVVEEAVRLFMAETSPPKSVICSWILVWGSWISPRRTLAGTGPCSRKRP